MAVCVLDLIFPISAADGWHLAVRAVFLALVLDLLFGDPKLVHARIGHPVTWIGGLISMLEKALYRPRLGPAGQVAMGAVLVAATVAACITAGGVIEWLGVLSGHGWIVTGVVGSIFIAARGLHDGIVAVAEGLSRNLADGRQAVGHVVGRDPSQLDEGGVARAALESLAENFSDGVVAPLFWFLLAGLPGLLAYKAINTLDSMVGYRNARYLYFGRIAARLDDLVNWPGARISGLLLCLAAGRSDAWRIMWRDRAKHASPNAAWPEAAMAGALNLSLVGPRIYDGQVSDGAWIGDGRKQATAADIRRGCVLYRWSCGLLAGALVIAAMF